VGRASKVRPTYRAIKGEQKMKNFYKWNPILVLAAITTLLTGCISPAPISTPASITTAAAEPIPTLANIIQNIFGFHYICFDMRRKNHERA